MGFLFANAVSLTAAFAIVTTFVCLSIVVKKRTQRAAIWSGGTLGTVGLICALAVSLVDKSQYLEQQLAFLVNIYLVISAIGANIFASAICLDLVGDVAQPASPSIPPEKLDAPSSTAAPPSSVQHEVPSTQQQGATNQNTGAASGPAQP